LDAVASFSFPFCNKKIWYSFDNLPLSFSYSFLLAIKENWCLSFSCIFAIKKRTGAYRFLVFWALKRSGTHLSFSYSFGNKRELVLIVFLYFWH